MSERVNEADVRNSFDSLLQAVDRNQRVILERDDDQPDLVVVPNDINIRRSDTERKVEDIKAIIQAGQRNPTNAILEVANVILGGRRNLTADEAEEKLAAMANIMGGQRSPTEDVLHELTLTLLGGQRNPTAAQRQMDQTALTLLGGQRNPT